MVIRRALLAALLAVACNEDADPASSDEVDENTEDDGLTATELLVRASLDVRGVRPTEEELDAVAADPAVADALIAAFVDDPAFAERVKQIFAGGWRTRIDEYYTDETYDELTAAGHAAVGEEPLNLIAYVAMNDLPFTAILDATETFVDPVLLDRWPLEELPNGDAFVPPGAVRARYTDGRPLAGVLSLNSVFWRHSSTVENANRGRANALSQALLCQSYLDRPIDFPTDLDLTDSDSIRDAIQQNPACQGCHSTMDPLASYLWGFMYPDEVAQPEYSIEGERMWQLYTDTPPGFFGEPGNRMVDLADQIGNDERFVSCAVRRVYEGLLGRKAELEDEGALAEHREAFLAANLSLKALVRSVLVDPTYRGQAWRPRFGGEPAAVVKKVAPVDVLAGSLTHLSGYTLLIDGRPATRLDFSVRTLAGGSDRGDATNVSTGAVLVQRRLAEAGAMNLVNARLEGRASGGRLDALLAGVDINQPPTEDIVQRLVRVARSKTLDPTEPELVALTAVWSDVAAVASPRDAWIALVTATLADPDHLLY